MYRGRSDITKSTVLGLVNWCSVDKFCVVNGRHNNMNHDRYSSSFPKWDQNTNAPGESLCATHKVNQNHTDCTVLNTWTLPDIIRDELPSEIVHSLHKAVHDVSELVVSILSRDTRRDKTSFRNIVHGILIQLSDKTQHNFYAQYEQYISQLHVSAHFRPSSGCSL